MDDLISFLSRQSTSVLQAALLTTNAATDIATIKKIMASRAYLSQKYSYSNLLRMTPDDLVKLLNSPELRISDLVISRSIMGKILDIIEMKYPQKEVIFCAELIQYLRRWSVYSADWLQDL